MRKLTVALTEKGKRIHIDNLKPEKIEGSLFCPHCKMEMIPRQGDNKAWHFAHKGTECDWQNLRVEDKTTKNDSLGSFMDKTTSSEHYRFAKATRFLCPLCNETHSIKEGKSWAKDEYVCEKCYRNITPEQTKILMDRNIIK